MSNVSSTSRFSKYNTGDFAQLVKLAESESFVGRLVGEHDYQNLDDAVFPVLELVDPKTGIEFAWRASAWHAREQLELVDPQHNDVIQVTRLADSGKSHQYKIEILQPAAGDDGLPQPTEGNDDDIPW